MDALLRDARFIVGIEMHTGKMTLEQGQEFFVKEGFRFRPSPKWRPSAELPIRHILYYTLGKLQILKLREDYRKQQGDAVQPAGISQPFHAAGGGADEDYPQEPCWGVIARLCNSSHRHVEFVETDRTTQSQISIDACEERIH